MSSLTALIKGRVGFLLCCVKHIFILPLECTVFLISLNFLVELLSDGKQTQSLCSLNCISSAHSLSFSGIEDEWGGCVGYFLGG